MKLPNAPWPRSRATQGHVRAALQGTTIVVQALRAIDCLDITTMILGLLDAMSAPWMIMRVLHNMCQLQDAPLRQATMVILRHDLQGVKTIIIKDGHSSSTR